MNGIGFRFQMASALVLAGLLGALPGVAAEENGASLKASAQDMARWRQLKFGLFVHWGPVSLRGTEIGWSRGGKRRGRDTGRRAGSRRGL